MSEIWESLFKLYGTKISLSCTYHWNTDGERKERNNQHWEIQREF